MKFIYKQNHRIKGNGMLIGMSVAQWFATNPSALNLKRKVDYLNGSFCIF